MATVYPSQGGPGKKSHIHCLQYKCCLNTFILVARLALAETKYKFTMTSCSYNIIDGLCSIRGHL